MVEALESLLAQHERDLAIVLVDDASTDTTPEVARFYVERDPRVTYERNSSRLGQLENWVRTFELARARHPEAEYFAQASDHDVWDPSWLQKLLGELEGHPEAALAYPLSIRIGEGGEPVRPQPPWRFDTAGVSDPAERFRRFCRLGVAGDMWYGLFRWEKLDRVPFSRALLFDRLLLARLSLVAEFRQVPEILWFRRYLKPVSASRQRATFFPDRPPAWSRVPWPLAHSVTLARTLPNQVSGDATLGRVAALNLAARYGEASVRRLVRKQLLRPVAAASRFRRRKIV